MDYVQSKFRVSFKTASVYFMEREGTALVMLVKLLLRNMILIMLRDNNRNYCLKLFLPPWF